MHKAHDTAHAQQEWDRVADGWRTWWETIEVPAQAVSERMLAMANVTTGHRILDIATGPGEPALRAARWVGPTGRVVATDVSPQMLAIARTRAAAAQLTNVEFREADAAELGAPPGSFDAVLCRWGITSLPDPHATLQTIHQLLTPNGAFVTAVWEAGATGRPLASLAMSLADAMFDASPPVRPTSHTASVEPALADALRHAGYATVRTERMAIPFVWASTNDCTQYMLDVSPDLQKRVAARPAAAQAEYRRRVTTALEPFVAVDGKVHISNVTVCAMGRR